MTRSRRLLLAWSAAAIVLAVIAAYLGWIAGSARDSDGDEATVATEVSASVREGRLIERARLSCTATPAVVGALADVRAQGAVSGLPQDVDGDVLAGDLVVEIDGAPVIAAAGPLRLYRDIGPGDVGADVAEVRAALVDRGLVSAKPDTTAWQSGEQRAWRQHLAQLGYPDHGRKVVEKGSVLVLDSLPATASWLPDAMGAEDLSALTFASGETIVTCPRHEGVEVPVDAEVTVVGQGDADVTRQRVTSSIGSEGDDAAGSAEGVDPDGADEGLDAAGPAADPAAGSGADDEHVTYLASGLDASHGADVLLEAVVARSSASGLIVPAAAHRTDAADLWPFAGVRPGLDAPTVVSRVFPARTEIPSAMWREVFTSTRERIDVLVYGGTFLFDAVPQFTRIITDAAARDVRIRRPRPCEFDQIVAFSQFHFRYARPRRMSADVSKGVIRASCRMSPIW